MSIILLLLAFVASLAHATAFDVWAESGKQQIWNAPGKTYIAKQFWEGSKGLALVVFERQPGYIQSLWVAGDAVGDEFTFMTWTEAQPADSTMYGQTADVASTGAGLAVGLSEANPLLATTPALIVVGAAKIAAVPLIKQVSFEACYGGIGQLESMGWGAAGWNAAAIIGLGPFGLIPAIGTAIYFYPDADKRFWACAPKTGV